MDGIVGASDAHADTNRLNWVTGHYHTGSITIIVVGKGNND
jgi:hypothetical protein